VNVSIKNLKLFIVGIIYAENSSVSWRFGLHDHKKELAKPQSLKPNIYFRNEITNSRDHLCSSNLET
jgi:hypothetical protein